MTDSPTPGNHFEFGDDAHDNVSIGGGNYGHIDNRSYYGEPEQQRHQMHVESRRPSIVTDRLMLWLNVVMTLTGLAGLGVSITQVMPPIQADGVAGLLHLPLDATWWMAGGMLALTTAMTIGFFRQWLSKRVYGALVIFGRVAEGRLDERGHLRLHWTKVGGTCAIDGSPMVPARVAAREDTLYMFDGTTRTKRSNFELRLVCTRVGHSLDHQARIDPASTEE